MLYRLDGTMNVYSSVKPPQGKPQLPGLVTMSEFEEDEGDIPEIDVKIFCQLAAWNQSLDVDYMDATYNVNWTDYTDVCKGASDGYVQAANANDGQYDHMIICPDVMAYAKTVPGEIPKGQPWMEGKERTMMDHFMYPAQVILHEVSNND
ncbi:hypothetical protein K461DRAFT_126136 [Myriangium duriaei CBS 260.36]|uniref:Uncharacterized protein n=1 Tax=Myriangium duriaei CBS 260.36 TaxID=1168546 RepID=A0A9P4MH27_9PEZI|nr:hypothetical protein K461DRAFT_126136 [Myriangium duriaei CBS 260.36]